MGFDIVHINIHKTFSTPHGGGGPGAAAILVKQFLARFLPIPVLAFDGEKYYWNYNLPDSIGKVRSYYGNIIPLIKAWLYILALGGEGLKRVTEQAVLNTNYFIKKIQNIRGYTLPYDPKRPRKHEVVISAKKIFDETGVSANDIAKRLLDYGVHAPTIYFPLIVREALMIEFTESESKEEIDYYIRALSEIQCQAYKDPDVIKKAPYNTSIRRLDELLANKPTTFTPTYRIYKKKEEITNQKRYMDHLE